MKIKLLIIPVIFLVSCSFFQVKDILEEPSESQELNVILIKGQNYSLNLGQLGIEDAVEIVEQAAHFERSEFDYDEYPTVYYVYEPETDYKGEDQVLIKRCISPGAGCGKEVRYSIHFTIK